jgi:hypothetical protein
MDRIFDTDVHVQSNSRIYPLKISSTNGISQILSTHDSLLRIGGSSLPYVDHSMKINKFLH